MEWFSKSSSKVSKVPALCTSSCFELVLFVVRKRPNCLLLLGVSIDREMWHHFPSRWQSDHISLNNLFLLTENVCLHVKCASYVKANHSSLFCIPFLLSTLSSFFPPKLSEAFLALYTPIHNSESFVPSFHEQHHLALDCPDANFGDPVGCYSTFQASWRDFL